jgi:uncharacterized membrane protein YfcA
MDNIFVLILTGFIIGTFGTLIGAGGGFLLVPLLIFTHPGMPAATTTAISIAVVAVNAISGSIAYARSGRIDYKSGLLFGAATMPGSIIGVFLVKLVPKHIFNLIFGCLLISVSLYLLLRKKDAENLAVSDTRSYHTIHRITDREGNIYSFSFSNLNGILISFVVGFLSPMLGIGGGIIHVPAMVQWLHFPVYIATATSHFVLAIMATVSVIVHFFEGSYNDPVVQKMLLGLSLGAVPGAQLGAYISHKIKTSYIIKILAVCLALVGFRILLK